MTRQAKMKASSISIQRLSSAAQLAPLADAWNELARGVPFRQRVRHFILAARPAEHAEIVGTHLARSEEADS